MSFFEFIKRIFIQSSSGLKPVPDEQSLSETMELVVEVHSINNQRLRGQHQDEFRALLWYASNFNEIYVYGHSDKSESTKPLAIIPQKYNNLILPYISREINFHDYRATFNKSSGQLFLKLVKYNKKAIKQKEEFQKGKHKQIDLRLQADHEKKMLQPYIMTYDIEHNIEVFDDAKIMFQRKRKVDHVRIEFYPKEKYINRDFKYAKLYVGESYIGELNLDIRVIRSYYSGADLIVKSCPIGRDRVSADVTWLNLLPVIGVVNN